MRILLLNGPPGCGKDKAAEIVQELYSAKHMKFANPLRSWVKQILKIHSDAELEELKREGPVVRDLMIGLSENTVKPVLGNDWFGIECALECLVYERQNIVISDAGFQYEVDAFTDTIMRTILSGHSDDDLRIHLIQIYRDGCSFEYDSRYWATLPEEVGEWSLVYNNGSIEELADQITLIADDLFYFEPGAS